MKHWKEEVHRHLQNNTSLLIFLWPCKYSKGCVILLLYLFKIYFHFLKLFLQSAVCSQIFDLDFRWIFSLTTRLMFWTPGGVVAVISCRLAPVFSVPESCFSCIKSFTKDDDINTSLANFNGLFLDWTMWKDDCWYWLRDNFQDDHHEHHHHG